MGKVAAVFAVLAMVMGCAPSLYITPAQTAPDGSVFYSVVNKANGHPAVTHIGVYRQKAGDQLATKEAEASGQAKGAAVDIASAGIQNTGAALALGLPASQLRPDTTTMTANPSVSSTSVGGISGSIANAGAVSNSAAVANAAAAARATGTGVGVGIGGGGFTPPGHLP